MRTAPSLTAAGAALLVLFFGGCGGPTASTDHAVAATATASAPTAPPDGEVCALLTDAEVRAIFPYSGTGKAERAREKYGIKGCIWEDRNGRLGMQLMAADGHSAKSAMRDMAEGFIDPLRADARQHVRFEPLQGLGPDATAVIESVDASKGIITKVAMMAAVKDGTTLMIFTDGLADGDRAQSLAKLQKLGQQAYARM